MRMYTPSSAATVGETYKADTEFFLKNKERSMFIREVAPNEFENGLDMALQLNLARVYMGIPKLWVLVFGDETLYFSVPVYRGEKFFQVKSHRGLMLAETLSDRATRILLAEMDARGGIEGEAFEIWKAKFLQAVAEHNQKELKPSEAIN
jgi:hypothetical protein